MGQRNVDKRWPQPNPTRWAWVRNPGPQEPPDQGLILEWRRESYRWSALVVRVRVHDGHLIVRQEWISRDHLVPVRSDPNLAPPWNTARPVNR